MPMRKIDVAKIEAAVRGIERSGVRDRSLHEPTGRANARPMTGSAICGNSGPGVAALARVRSRGVSLPP